MARDDPAIKNDEPENEEEEEDLVDPMEELKESCGRSDSCVGYKEKLEVCTDRVSSRKNTTENCEEELFDYIHCVDKCLTGSLFSKLK